MSQTRCPLCLSDVRRWEAHTCLECKALLHDGCVRELGSCHAETQPPTSEHLPLERSEVRPSLAPWAAHTFSTARWWPTAHALLSLLAVAAGVTGLSSLTQREHGLDAMSAIVCFALPLTLSYLCTWSAVESLLTGVTRLGPRRVTWHAEPLAYAESVGTKLLCALGLGLAVFLTCAYG